jgi:AraC-like DNA-binding protein
MERVPSPAIALRRYDTCEASDVHDFHQVVLSVDGAMVMAVDGVGRRIDRHAAWLIPAGARHEYAGLGENRQLVLDLPAASLALPQRLFDRARAVSIDPALTSLVAQLATAAAQLDGPADAARVASSGTLRRACAMRCSTTPASPRPLWASISRASTAGCARLAEPLRIADLAAHCGYGMRRFHQLFVDAFGETPHRYLQRLRLDAAVVLLADGRHPLVDIAGMVGFADQSTFTHAFTKRFGVAPGRWRSERH